MDRRLTGLTVYSTPVHGPTLPGAPPLPPLTETFRLLSFVDDIKASIKYMHEFFLVDKASLLFEKASGCQLHRDPASGKVKFLSLGRWRGTLKQEDIPVKYIALSDYLDMLGVTMKATFTQTRKVNCDDITEKVRRLIGSWKGGRFIPLSQRPFSVNAFALPLVWFRCHSLDLREGDFSKITSIVKSWVFADCLEKPEELTVFKSKEEGGLGIHHLKSKSRAILIKSFLETATGSKFIQNNYHNALFRWHILQQNNIQDPGIPPYYSASFFKTIREVMSEGTKDVSKMSSSEWYRILLKKYVTEELGELEETETKLLKAERKHPEVDWERTWSLMLTKGLNGRQKSLIFKILHNILPTRARLHRMGLSDSPNCDLCPHGIVGDLTHALLDCDHNSVVNDWIIAVLFDIDPGLLDSELSSKNITTLNLNISEEKKLPVHLFLLQVFEIIWNRRLTRRMITLTDVQTTIQAEVSFLMNTKHDIAAQTIESALNFSIY